MAGDGYPLCSRLVPRHFLRTGARYVYHGQASPLGAAFDNTQGSPNIRPHFTPDASGSSLYRVGMLTYLLLPPVCAHRLCRLLGSFPAW